MDALVRVSPLLALLLGLCGQAQAQEHTASIGYGGGGAWFGSFNEGAGGDLVLDPGWVVTTHLDWWPGTRRIGGRLSASFTQRPLETSGDVRSVNVWMLGGEGLLRLLPAVGGRAASPFVSLGAGVVSYGLGDGPAIDLPAEAAVYPGDTDRRVAATGGVGIDVMPPGLSWFGTPIGLRIEAVDHVVIESPFQDPDGEAYGPVHNVRFNLSLLGLVEFLY